MCCSIKLTGRGSQQDSFSLFSQVYFNSIFFERPQVFFKKERMEQLGWPNWFSETTVQILIRIKNQDGFEGLLPQTLSANAFFKDHTNSHVYHVLIKTRIGQHILAELQKEVYKYRPMLFLALVSNISPSLLYALNFTLVLIIITINIIIKSCLYKRFILFKMHGKSWCFIGHNLYSPWWFKGDNFMWFTTT